MPQQEAKEEAVRSAMAKLASVDMGPRLAALGLSAPVTVTKGLHPAGGGAILDGGLSAMESLGCRGAADTVRLRAFGQDVALNLADFAMTNVKTGKPAGMTDRILILHYLLCDVPVPVGTEMITYRDFTGGQFYLQPFLSRTAKPLTAKIGNDLEKLKKNLGRFDWQPVPVPPGDFSARVHALGNLHVTLVYTLGDEEFPASCEVLFDAATKRVYGAEDAAVLASRICIGLL